MKKSLVAVLALAFAVPALADPSRQGPIDRSNTPILQATNPQPMAPGSLGPRAVPRYDSLGPGAGGYTAFSAATGPVGFDDFDSTSPTPTFVADQFMVAASIAGFGPGSLGSYCGAGGGGVAFWTFFNTAGTAVIDSFGVAFPSSGAFIWTITFTGVVNVPDAGFIQMFVDPQYFCVSTGFFALTTPDAVVLGTNSPLTGGASTTGGATFVHAWSITDEVPDPATMSLLGLGGLFLARRRRS
jgi:MYXO-CTERM domain-containing protein